MPPLSSIISHPAEVLGISRLALLSEFMVLRAVLGAIVLGCIVLCAVVGAEVEG